MRRTKAQVYAALAAPIPAVLIGIGLMRLRGVAPLTIIIHGIGLVVGAFAFFAARRAGAASERRARLLVPMALLAALAGSFVAPGIEGVHRWIPLGPLQLHASSLLAPAALVAIAGLLADGRAALGLAIAVAAQLLHVLQPDAASATAFAAGIIAAAVSARALSRSPSSARDRVLIAGGQFAVISGAILAWTMPDPLLPVPHVEGILEIAASQGVALQVIAWISLAIAPAMIAWGSLDERSARAARIAALAVAAHLAAAILASRFGSFPVPLLGFGASPVLGIYIGLGLHATLCGKPQMPA